MSIRVVIADDMALIRAGLKNLLETQSDIEVVGQAGDSGELIQVVNATAPSVVITDVMLQDHQIAEIIPGIIMRYPQTKFVALSTALDKRFVIGMLKAGASAYLSKGCDFDELVQAVRTVSQGRAYLSASVSDVIVQSHFQNRDGLNPGDELLSPREGQVLQMLADGRSTKEIAETYHISKKTVETHRAHVMQKLNLGSMAELVKYAVREGLTTLHK